MLHHLVLESGGVTEENCHVKLVKLMHAWNRAWLNHVAFALRSIGPVMS